MFDIKSEKHEYSCAMAPIPKEYEKALLDWSKEHISDDSLFIDPKDGSKGRQDYFHVTIKYGLHDAKPTGVQQMAKELPIEPFSVTLGPISLFEHDDFDVVKIEVKSPYLHKLHKEMSDAFENTEEYPDYKPHLTLAYVKKGTAKDLVGDDTFKDQEAEITSVDFSSKDGGMTNIPLTKIHTQAKTASLLADPRIVAYFEARGVPKEDYLDLVSDVQVKYWSKNTRTEAYYVPLTNSLVLSEELKSGPLTDSDVAVIVHELEHVIQRALNLGPEKKQEYRQYPHEWGAFISEAKYLLSQGKSEAEVLQHLHTSLPYPMAKQILEIAHEVDPQFVTATQNHPSHIICTMCMLGSLAHKISLLEATKVLMEDSESFLNKVAEYRKSKDYNFEAAEQLIDQAGGWDKFCELVLAKLGLLYKQGEVYTDKEQEEIYEKTREDSGDHYWDSTGGGNVYHDWNQDTSDYPKPKDIDKPHTRLDQLVPMKRRDRRWIVPPRGDQTDLFTAPADSGDIGDYDYTASKLELLLKQGQDLLNFIRVDINPTENLDSITGKALLLDKQIPWSAQTISTPGGTRLYQLDTTQIDKAIDKLNVTAPKRREFQEKVHQSIREVLQSQLVHIYRKTPNLDQIEEMFNKLPAIWWSKTDVPQVQLKLSYVNDMLMRQQLDPGYFQAFPIGQSENYSWTLANNTLIVTKSKIA